MSIFPRLNQRTKILLPIRTNLATYNEIPEHTVIGANTEIPSVLDGPTVVQRYRNLTIDGGCTLTTSNRCCGLVLVVDGDLTVNGTISMTARGANLQPPSDHRITNELLPGKEVYYEIDIPATADEIAAFLLKEKRRYHSLDELPAIYRPTLYARGPQGNVYAPAADFGVIPAVGGAGGAGRANENGDGSAGTAGTGRKCGGGGGGGLNGGNPGMRGGNGGSGTCYSGGTGGGGSYSSIGGDGSNYGGSGGGGSSITGKPNYGSGGAGNPGGLPGITGGSAQSGGTGTGGLLIIVCTGAVVVNGSIGAHGAAGGNATLAGGGGSGGGSINIFYGSLTNNGSILASGGTGGVASGAGGAGGAGCVTLDQYNF